MTLDDADGDRREPAYELATAPPLEATNALAITREPEIVLAEAQRAARALRQVIDAKARKVVLNGETYLEFEDWQTLGRFYGIAARTTHTGYIEHGDCHGWEATAEAVHVETATVVSSAEAMCLTDEDHWRVRPRYEWHYVCRSGHISAEDPGPAEIIWEAGRDGKRRPKRQRVLLGDEPVPSYQRRSMAQTRACAKALRNALAWVVVLAGYRPTPAEESGGEMDRKDDAPAAAAALSVGVRASTTPTTARTPEPSPAEEAEEETGTGDRSRNIGELVADHRSLCGELSALGIDEPPLRGRVTYSQVSAAVARLEARLEEARSRGEP